ncbi:DUF4399 domain-containing protein [uncultured Imperialibacter sp.]|uniref:DUF4399 domain-containing protein n=1 Tax=uncultured Imperialibacter sp. TaxID=1672639 RepID=UPI0030D70936|tara:strand:+ start:16093 stop:16551 length:459 start_codon:yes stop_codon:yes gene_type:complete
MRKILLGAMVAFGVYACSSPKTENTEETASTSEATETVAEAVKPRVFFKSPADGATVSNPVFVEMGVEGMQIEPAGQVKEGFGHHHILINQEFWPKGEVIPASDSTIHFGKGQTDTQLELAPGDYTISLQFADGVHTSYGPEMATSIKITVK